MTYDEQQEIERKAREDAAKPWFKPDSGDHSWTKKTTHYGDTYENERKRLGN